MRKKLLAIVTIYLFIFMTCMSLSTSATTISKSFVIDDLIDTASMNGDNKIEYWAICVDVHGDYRGSTTKSVLCNQGWREDHIRVLNGKQATKINLYKALFWLNANEDQDDVVLLWLFGHGNIGKFALYRSYITYKELDKKLDKLDSGKIGIVIDACHSGSAISKITNSGRIIVTSCRDNETSGAIINKCLCALQGYGDYMGDKDGNISIEEMFDFLIQHEEGLDYVPQIDDNIPGELDISFIEESDSNPDQFQTLFFYNFAPVDSKIARAQAFKPSFNKINRVKLFAGRRGHPGTLIVSIRKNLTDDDLSSVIIPKNYIPTSVMASISYDFYFPEVEVIPGETYYIVCRTEEPGGTYDEYFLGYSSGIGDLEFDAYENGDMYTFTAYDGWVVENGSDLCFITFYYNDNCPPNVEITKPTHALYIMNIKIRNYLTCKSLVIGRIVIKVEASDEESGIGKVEFYIDDELIEIDTAKPYSWTWKKGSLLKYKYTLDVVAYDKAGNSASEKLVVWKFF